MTRKSILMATAAFGIALAGTSVLSQSQPATEGPAVGETPAWFLQGSFPDPTGRTIVEAGGKVTVPPRPEGAGGGRAGGGGRGAAPAGAVPGCSKSPLCGRRGGTPRQSMQRVQWKQTMGYTFSYPYNLPPGFGGVPAVALDSKGNLWVYPARRCWKATTVQVRPQCQTDPPGRQRCDRIPGKSARHGRRR